MFWWHLRYQDETLDFICVIEDFTYWLLQLEDEIWVSIANIDWELTDDLFIFLQWLNCDGCFTNNKGT